MKITMLKTMCGPQGNADPGGVLDLLPEEAKLLLSKENGGPFARRFDAEKDAKPRHVGYRRYVVGDA